MHEIKTALSSLSTERKALLGVLAAVVAYLVLTSVFPDFGAIHTPTHRLGVGKEIDVGITLVTADVTDLACASDEEIDGARCLHDGRGQPRSDAPPGAEAGASAKVLAPYMTTDSVLFLIPGLFGEPAVLRRLNEEPPSGDREKLRRFTAECRLKVVGKVNNFAVRWMPNAAFDPRDEAWVGRVSNCQIKG